MRLSLLLAVLLASSAMAAEIYDGHPNHVAYSERVAKLGNEPNVKIESIGSSVGQRNIWAITITTADAQSKPAIAVVGGLNQSSLLSSELALQMAETIVAQREREDIKRLLDSVTLYIIPRPDPDLCEKLLTKLHRPALGNARPTDDDHDGKLGEDGPDDLNADGLITSVRVEDETGGWIQHPGEPRLLIPADIAKGERGQYRVLLEGRDDDHDEQFNEDASDGVVIDRNFPHRFNPLQSQAGTHAASEPETRALIDFLFDRPHVFAVFCFSPEENLFHPWKGSDSKEKQRLPTHPPASDAPYLEAFGNKYRELFAKQEVAKQTPSEGTFQEWSYYQYGRWTFTSRGWWPPKIEAKEEDKAKTDPRAADELALLKWLDAEKLPGYVAWQEIKHPDFPGKKVEVGGWVQGVKQNPPVSYLASQVDPHVKFVAALAEARPRLRLVDVQLTTPGDEPRVKRLSLQVENTGLLPTLPEMGVIAESHQHVQIELQLPAGAKCLNTPSRVKLPRLDSSSRHKVNWLILLPDDKPFETTVRLWSPEIEEVAIPVPVKP